jgi:chromosome segregation ATPase
LVSVVGVVNGSYLAVTKMRADRDRARDEAEERDRQRHHEAEQAELARRERQHDFAGQLHVLTLKLHEVTSENAELRRAVEHHDSQIESNQKSVNILKQIATDSGQFPAVSDLEDDGGSPFGGGVG